MEVKSVYMDLVEGKRRGNVWRLESEAFKKPIEIKICYDNKDLAQFNSRFEWVEKVLKAQEETNIATEKELNERIEHEVMLKKQLELQEKFIQEQANKLSEQGSDLKELYKAIADAKSVIEMQSGTILKLQEQVKLLEKKVTKQPMVFHDKQFISWRESCGLRVCDIPDGDYLMLLNTRVGEHNEYVENEDGLIVEKIHVSWNYVPFYKLVWGTELDVPTATIYYDLVFIPI